MSVEAEGAAPVPATYRKELAQVDASLYSAIALWLKKHGKGMKPKLSDEQKQQLKECFELMDQDGSGAIDADELGAAFKLLGIRMKKPELEALLAEVDHDGSGEVEYQEFLEIMTVTLQRLAEEQDAAKNEGQVPFALMATAYRRKRLMEGIINGDKEVQAQIQQISDKHVLEQLQATKAAEVESLRGKSPAGYGASGSGRFGGTGRVGTGRRGGFKRLGQVNMDKQILSSLSPEERRLVSSVFSRSKAHAGGALQTMPQLRLPPVPGNGPGAGVTPLLLSSSLGGSSGNGMPFGMSTVSSSGSPGATMTTLKSPSFSSSPLHKQLTEMPQTFDLTFNHASIIKLPPGASTAARATMQQQHHAQQQHAEFAMAGAASGGRGSSRGGGGAGDVDLSVNASSTAELKNMRYEGAFVYPSPRQPVGKILNTGAPAASPAGGRQLSPSHQHRAGSPHRMH